MQQNRNKHEALVLLKDGHDGCNHSSGELLWITLFTVLGSARRGCPHEYDILLLPATEFWAGDDGEVMPIQLGFSPSVPIQWLCTYLQVT